MNRLMLNYKRVDLIDIITIIITAR